MKEALKDIVKGAVSIVLAAAIIRGVKYVYDRQYPALVASVKSDIATIAGG